MNEAMKNLLERRSVRGYKKDLVPAEVLDEILEAGKYAPSGMGQQKTLMVITQKPELVAKLSKMNADVMGMQLKSPYKEVAYAHFCKELSVPEIAQQTGKNPKTVQTQLYRARAMLKKMLERGD